MIDSTLAKHVVAQPGATRLLGVALSRSFVNHAYLFIGPSRVGKTTLATYFALGLNCEDSDARPCLVCRPCRLALRERYPELHLITPGVSLSSATQSSDESTRREIGRSKRAIVVSQVAQIESDVTTRPTEGRYKVYIIPEAWRLTTESANKLLKLLEEPPPGVVFILIAESTASLLPTVVSRCQVVRFHLSPKEEIEQALIERLATPAEKSQLIARLASGRVGWAIVAAKDESVLVERETRLEDLARLSESVLTERFAYSEKLARDYSKDPDTVVRVLGLWIGWWRDILLVKSGCEELVANLDYLVELREKAQKTTLPESREAISAIQETIASLGQNVNPRLAIDSLLIAFPSSSAIPTAGLR